MDFVETRKISNLTNSLFSYGNLLSDNNNNNNTRGGQFVVVKLSVLEISNLNE